MIDYGDGLYEWVLNSQHPGLPPAGQPAFFDTWKEGHAALIDGVRFDYDDLAQYPDRLDDTNREWQRAFRVIDNVEENQPFCVYFNGRIWWLTPDIKTGERRQWSY